MGWMIALTLGLALVRRTGAGSLLVGICLGSLVEIVHGDEEIKRKGEKER